MNENPKHLTKTPNASQKNSTRNTMVNDISKNL